MAQKKSRALGRGDSSSRKIWSWALYDWANSAFATTVMVTFFPLFFKKYWGGELSAIDSTAVLGYMSSITSVVLAATSPLFGAIADEGGLRKRMLMIFTLMGALATLWLFYVGPGGWYHAAWAYSVAVFGFTAALTFYDALLVQVAQPKLFDRVSGFGYALGYLGGGILLAANVAMYAKFGADGVRWSFVSVAAWWLLFSIPIFLFVPEPPGGGDVPLAKAARMGFQSLHEHLQLLYKEKKLLFFLLGYLFYIDGVNTLAKMAVDYGLAIGLDAEDLIKAILMVQFIGFPSAIWFGRIGERIGPLPGIWICLVAYLGVTVYSYFLNTALEFYLVAAVIGLVQGGIQSLSRSYYARLVPAAKSAEYFGIFNMTGKFSAILGPFLVAAAASWMRNSRAAIVVLAVFFLCGGFFLGVSRKLGGAK